jgi:hypothetical protein
MAKIKILSLIFVVLFLNACSPRTERGLIGGSQTCLMSNNTGTCNGFYTQVYGENQKSFEKIFVLDDNAVYLNLTVSSTDGKLTTAVKQYGEEEEWTTIEVEPGIPAVFKGWVIPDENGLFTIQFNQFDKQKTGRVNYDFSFLR